MGTLTNLLFVLGKMVDTCPHGLEQAAVEQENKKYDLVILAKGCAFLA